MSDAVAALLEGLAAILPEGEVYPLHEPYFGGEEEANVLDCVRSGWVSSVGSYVDQFEQDLAAYTGAKHAIVTMNGTAALHLCYMLSGVQAGDEVLCPSLTFVATANTIRYCDATPHFVDVDEARLTVCPEKLRSYLEAVAEMQGDVCVNKQTGAPIRALVVMHTFGLPADLAALSALCDAYNIALIEDAAESLGSFYKGVHTGNHGRCSALSFNGNKILTTGGGGAILTNDVALAKRAKHLSTTAKQPHPYAYIHDKVGYNYRMPNLNAALGVAQLKQLPDFLKAKRTLAERYQALCEALEGIEFIAEPEQCQTNYWLNAIKLPDAASKAALLDALHARQIFARPIWQPMHLLDIYKDCPRAPLPNTEALAERVVNLPSSVGLAQRP